VGLVVGNRGLLFFSPFLALFDLSGRSGDPLDAVDRRWLAAACLGTLLFYACYPVWWGGENYGARYMLDGLPLLFVLGAHTLENRLGSPRGIAFAAGALLAVGVQAIGAFGFPGGASGLASIQPPQLLGLRRSTAYLALQAAPMPPQLAPLALLGAQRSLPAGAEASVELLAEPPWRWPVRERYPLWFRVTNRSAVPLPAWGTYGGDFAVQPVVRWRRRASDYWTVEEFGLRGDLPQGRSRDFLLQLVAPEVEGVYDVEVLVVERGSPYRVLGQETRRVTVSPPGSGIFVLAPSGLLHRSDFETGDSSDWSDTQEAPDDDTAAAEAPPR